MLYYTRHVCNVPTAWSVYHVYPFFSQMKVRVANTFISLCFSPGMKFVILCRREIVSKCVVNVYIVEIYSELVQIIQQVYSSYYVNL